MPSCSFRRPAIRILQISQYSRRNYAHSAESILAAFQQASEATFLAAASSIDSIPKLGGLPEVVVTGRANVGKSTLLNAVLGRANLVRTSKKAGRTRALNFFRVGREPGQLVLVDAPGYGARGREEWGLLWEHYVDSRSTLRQICLLINAHHGLTDFDRAMLGTLASKSNVIPSHANSNRQLTLQPILTKLDMLEGSEDTRASTIRSITKELKKIAPMAESPILCAITPKFQLGIEAVREAMARSCSKIARYLSLSFSRPNVIGVLESFCAPTLGLLYYAGETYFTKLMVD